VPKQSPVEPDNRPLAEVLTSLGVTQWNVCLIGDGSGCKADDPGGWGCTLIDRLSGQRHQGDCAANK